MVPHLTPSRAWLALLLSAPALAQQTNLTWGLRYDLNLTFAANTSTAETCQDLNQNNSITLSTKFQPYRGDAPQDYFVSHCIDVGDLLAGNSTTASSSAPWGFDWRAIFSIPDDSNTSQLNLNLTANSSLAGYAQFALANATASSPSDGTAWRKAPRRIVTYGLPNCTVSDAIQEVVAPGCGPNAGCTRFPSDVVSLGVEVPGPWSEGDEALEEDGECLVKAPTSGEGPDENGAVGVDGRRLGIWRTGGMVFGVLGVEVVGGSWWE